jgi:hypothetical protein
LPDAEPAGPVAPDVPVEVGRGVGRGEFAVDVVFVVDVVVVLAEPPLIDGLTLMIGWTVIAGE